MKGFRRGIRIPTLLHTYTLTDIMNHLNYCSNSQNFILNKIYQVIWTNQSLKTRSPINQNLGIINFISGYFKII